MESIVFVTTGYETFYVSNKGRIISACPVGTMHGLKPAALGQYNQWDGVTGGFSVVCREEDLDVCLGRFVRLHNKRHAKFYVSMAGGLDRPLQVSVMFDRARNDDPLHDKRRAKAARIKREHEEGR